jgi:hypothetical protein
MVYNVMVTFVLNNKKKKVKNRFILDPDPSNLLFSLLAIRKQM